MSPYTTLLPFDCKILPLARIISPVEYEVNPVPPFVAPIAVAFHVPVVIVPQVVIDVCPG